MVKVFNLVRAAVLASALVLSGCGKEEGHGEKGHGHGEEHGKGPEVTPAHSYAGVIKQIQGLSREIDEHIEKNQLDKVHHEADQIRKLAERLPELAKNSMPAGMLKEINKNAKALADMFEEIDEAADAGKKDETIQVHDKMKKLIAELAKHAAHGKEKETKHPDD